MFNLISVPIDCFCNVTIPVVQTTTIFASCCSLCGCGLQDDKMSTVPYGCFMANKIRENDNKLSKIEAAEREREKLFKQYTLQLNPMKYNSKMMNSIWGMYNRYSVHNLKKIMDDNVFLSTGNQQMSSVASSVDKASAFDNPNNNKKNPQFRVKNGLWLAPENFN